MSKTRSKPDYLLKSDVINKGIHKLQRKASLSLHHIAQNEKIGVGSADTIKEYKNDLTIDQICDLKALYSGDGIDYWREAEKINDASYKRVKRLKDKIETMTETTKIAMMFNKDIKLLFVTLNFNDSCLEHSTAESRRQYVRKFFKNYCSCYDYIANIDFGSDAVYLDRNGVERKGTAREHYHAVVLCDWIDMKQWTHGFAYVEHVRIGSDEKLAKYVTKLTNHAVKETTKRNVLIYCREKRDVLA